MLNILVLCVFFYLYWFLTREHKHSIQAQDDQLVSSVNESHVSCFVARKQKYSTGLCLLKKNFIHGREMTNRLVCLCEVTGYVRWVNMNLLHHNAKFSHLCNPNRHSIKRQFRLVAPPPLPHPLTASTPPPMTQNDPQSWNSTALKAQKGSGGSKCVLKLTLVYFFLSWWVDKNQQLEGIGDPTAVRIYKAMPPFCTLMALLKL